MFQSKPTISVIFFCVICIVTVFAVFRMSRADEVPADFSLMGTINQVSSTSLEVVHVVGSGIDGDEAVIVEISPQTIIESDKYAALQVSQLQSADNIIVQGNKKDGSFISSRIIKFVTESQVVMPVISEEKPKTEANLTIETNIATSTDSVDAVIPEAGSSSDPVIEPSKDTVNIEPVSE